MSPLPVDVFEEIIDAVAERSPQSLPDCVLVSRQWNPRSTYQLHRIFRTPTVTTFDGLHTFVDIVKNHPRLAALAQSLEIAPDPNLNVGFASYVPFHHLSTRILPHVRHLVLGKGLRWMEFPPLYNKGAFGSSFSNVTSIELSCHFGSVENLYRAVRSFRNVKEVRLSYPHHVLPQWTLSQRRIDDLGHGRPFRGMFKLRNLELPVELLQPILNVFGDSVVNLFVRGPQMSTISTDTVERGKQLASGFPLTSLQAVKIQVSAESDSPTDNTDLSKLHHLFVAPITKPGVRYSLSVVQCRKHNAGGYHVEDINATELGKIIAISPAAIVNKWDPCRICKPSRWLLLLNNYAQRNGLQRYILWGQPEHQRSSPRSVPTWTVSVFFNRTEYGRGSAATVNVAKDIAAEQALRALWSTLGA